MITGAKGTTWFRSRLTQPFRAKPWVRAKLAQRDIGGTLLDVDLVDADGASAINSQNLLRHIFLFRRANAHPQDQPTARQQFLKVLALASKAKGSKRETDAAGNNPQQRRGYDSLRRAAAGCDYPVGRPHRARGTYDSGDRHIENGYIIPPHERPPGRTWKHQRALRERYNRRREPSL